MRSLELAHDDVVDALLHEEARAGAAHVALVEVDAVDDAFDGLVDGRVGEDDVRRLAAELEGEALLAVPAMRFWMRLPTSVLPVKAILSTSGWLTSAAPVSPAPVTMLTTPGGQLGLLDDLRRAAAP